jgi:hypothetical protein
MPTVTGDNFYIDKHNLQFRTGVESLASIEYSKLSESISINNAGTGSINIGDAGGDIFIGDGLNQTDIVFEQNGAIRGLSNKTLSLGQPDSFVQVNAQDFIVSGDAQFSGQLTVDGNPVMTGANPFDEDTLQTVTDRGATTTNNIEIQGAGTKSLTVDSTNGHASVIIDRHSSSYDANLMFQTNGATHWRLWNDSNDSTLSIRDEANASNVMTWEVGGNVGIGTDDPDGKLHIETAASSQTASTQADELIVENSTHGGISILTPDASRAHLYFNQGAFLRWQDSLFTIDTSNSAHHLALKAGGGNVGIGTTGPNQKLEVKGGNINIQNGDGAFLTFNNGDANLTVHYDGSTGRDLSFKTWNSTQGNIERMRLDKDGNLGIGTNSPSAPLDISSSATGGTTIELDNTSTGGRNWTLYSSGSGNSFGAGKFALYDADAASVRMLVDTAGNVGIGTATPATPLHVNGEVRVDSNNGVAARQIRSSYFSSGQDLTLTAGSAAAVKLKTGSTVHLTVNNNGTVGIGTVSPAGELEVQGTGDLLFLRETGREAVSITGQGNGSGSQMVFKTHSGSSLAEAMRILPSGNVGIGSNTPSVKLDVNGNIKASQVGVTNIVTNKIVKFGGAYFDDSSITDDGSIISIGSDTNEKDFIVYGNDTGEKLSWDGSESKLQINHDTNDFGLGIFTVSSAGMTQPQLKVGRDQNQYWGVYTDDRNAHLVHRQDETSGNMSTRFDQWDSNTSDNNGFWAWRVGNGSGASMQTAMTLTQAGGLTLGGSLTLGGTGRIQGIDTVTDGTDATSKTYVDNAITSGLGSYLPLAGGTLTGALTISTSADAMIDLDQTGSDTGWSYINFKTLGTRNYYVGQDSSKNFNIYNDNIDVVALSVSYASNLTTIGGDLTVAGGDITLSGTGRIQGIDTVSSGTDATSKTYVDNAISSGVGSYLPLSGGTMTGDLILDDGSGNSPTLRFQDGNDIKFNLYSDGNSLVVTREGNSGADFVITAHASDYTNSSLTIGGATVSPTKIGQWNTAYNYSQVGHLPLSGGTMTGAIAMGASQITNLGDPTSAQDAATKNYVDTTRAEQVTFTRSGINNSSYTMLCTVDGDRLGSIVNMTITGTSNAVVLSSSFEINVNHYQDIHVRSLSGDYSEATIRITSNNNEDYSIELKHNGNTTTTVEVCVFPQAGETITPTTTDPNYTGTEYVHIATEGIRFGGTDGATESSNLVVDGKVGIGTASPAGAKLEIQTTAGSAMMQLRPNAASSALNPLILYRSQLNGSANYMLCEGTSTYFGTYNGGTPSDKSEMIRILPSSADAPSLRIGDAGSTGANLQVGGNIKLLNNGTSYINGGDVGIGSTTPAHKLDVAGSIQAKDAGFLAGVGGDSDGFIFHDLYTAGGVHYGYKAFSNSTRLSTVTDGVERLTVDVNGNVGIGTTAPANALHVVGTRIRLDTNAGGFYQYTAGGGFRFALYDDSSKTRLFADGDGSNPYMTFNAGFVGIATENPTSPLTIKSSSVSASDSALTIQGNSNTNAIVKIAEKSTDGARFHMYDGGVEKIAFYTDGTDNHISAGNVGIGLTNPSIKLEVNSAGTDEVARFQSTDNDSYISISDNTDAVYIGHDAALDVMSLGFSSSMGVSSNVNIDTDGHVGIGTNNPSHQLEIGLTSSVSLANQPAEPLHVSNNGQSVDGRVFISVKHDKINTASAIGAGLKMTAAAVTTGTASYFDSLIYLESASPGSDTIHSAPKAIKFYVDNHATNAGSGTNYNDLGDLALTISEDAKVGIGTSPNRNLSIVGQIGIDNSTSPTGGMLIAPDGSSNKIYSRTGNSTASPHPLDFLIGSDLAMTIDADSHVLINGANDNSNSADFAVGVGGSPRVSWHGNQVQIGGTDMNYNGNITHDGTFRMTSWSSSINFMCNSSSGSSTRDISFTPFNGSSPVTSVTMKGAGQVGIGTDTPGDGDLSINTPRLHVRGPDTASAFNLVARFQGGNDNNNTGAAILINHSNDRGLLINAGRADSDREVAYFNLVSSGANITNMLTLKKVGNYHYVGVGTTSPTTKFHIDDNDTSGTGLLVTGGGVGNALATFTRDVGGSGSVEINSNSSRPQIKFAASSNTFALGVNGSTFEIADNTGLGTNARLSITNTGNVGIGVTDPDTLLEVAGVIKSSSTSRVQADVLNNSANSANIIYRSSTSTIVGNNASALVILDGGNVGIGTTNPQSYLDVKTQIRVRDSNSDDTHALLDSNASEGRLRLNNGSNWGLIARGSANNPYLGAYYGGSLNIVGFSSSDGASVHHTLTKFDFANQRVGIGTTNPLYKLHVAGTTYVNGGTLFIDSGQQLLWGNSNQGIRGTNDTSLEFRTGGSTKMLLDNSGNVGIGTTNPQEELHVFGKIRTYATSETKYIRMFGGNSGNFLDSFGNTLFIRYGGDSNKAIVLDSLGNVGINKTSPTQKLDIGAGHIRLDAGYSLQWDNSHERIEQSDGHLEFFVNNTESMTLDTNGLGIGTTSPSSKLHVAGQIMISPSSGTPSLKFQDSGTTNAYIDLTDGQQRFDFRDDSDTVMSVTLNTLRVGIGTTNPSQKLHVEGNIELTSGFQIGSNSGSYWQRIRTEDASASTTNAFNFETRNGSGSFIDHMVIRNDGNVGIGVTNPSYTLQVGGSIVGTSKSFLIKHPTKEGKKLLHACIEGPENGVYYRGKSTSNIIEMPDYWVGLVHIDSMTVDITAIGPNQDLYVDSILDNGNVTIGSNTESPLNYFYAIYGERKDIGKLEIEIDDPD